MNKAKKEALRKHREARQGKTGEEIMAIDEAEAQLEKLAEMMSDVHYELFPEEYDFYFDSIADAKDRTRGINPMSDEYIKEVNARRVGLGVPPLPESGQGHSPESVAVARKEADRRMEMAAEI